MSNEQHDSIVSWGIYASFDLDDLTNVYVYTIILPSVIVNIRDKTVCSETFMLNNCTECPTWGLLYRGILRMLQGVSAGQYWAWAWDLFPDRAEKPF